MAANSKIEWTDATWNPVTGCSVISPGCTNCYAMKLAGTRMKHHPSRAGLTRESKAGPVWTGEVRLNEKSLTEPLKWQRPRKIFVCAHGDLFHEAVPDEWIDRVFAVMALAPQHQFQVLTKRSKRMREYLTDTKTTSRIASDGLCEVTVGFSTRSPLIFNVTWPLPNVLLGISVEDQVRADERRDDLSRLARLFGWRTFVSYEPALGPVDWTGWEFLSWLISGGESQKGARPSHPDWHRAARDFAAANKIPYHFKQWGNFLPDDQQSRVHPYGSQFGKTPHAYLNKMAMWGVGKARAGRLLDGIEHNNSPESRQ